ncbi:MAG: ABC transporter permease subunit [Candidatus Dormibacteria bacterium]
MSGVAVQLAVDSVAAAALYAIIGLVVALAFSGTGVLFVATGQVGAAGALVAAALVAHAVPVAIAVVAGMLVAALVAALAERGLVEPVSGHPLAGTALLVALAVVVQEALAGIFPAPAYAFPTVDAEVRAGAGIVRAADLVVVGCALLIAAATATVLQRTTLGTRIRLAAHDAAIAERLGVRTARLRAGSFALAGAAAAAVVLLAAGRFPVSAATGVVLGVRGLAVAAGARMAVGPRIALTALALGTAEVVSGYWLGSGGEAITDTVAAALVIAGALW